MNIYVARELWADRFSVYFRKNTHLDSRYPAYMLPAQFKVKTKEEEGMEVPPAMQLTKDEAQEFMDALWNAGIRPTEGTGSAGSLAATQKHLEDMRSIVFKHNPLSK